VAAPLVSPPFRHFSQSFLEEAMKRIGLFAVALFLTGGPAIAGSVEGNGALSLAAIVGQYSPIITKPEREVLSKLLSGQKNAPYGAAKKVAVTADGITCRVGNVDITLHLCELTFGSKKVTINGRASHELYATLAEVGVPPDGAAGTIFEGVSNLKCEIEPSAIKKSDGSGAHCAYDPSK
jgi:hypothetical protein